jgi:hypothetical protein
MAEIFFGEKKLQKIQNCKRVVSDPSMVSALLVETRNAKNNLITKATV